MNNKKIKNSVLYVGKAETKKERQRILNKIFSDEKLGISRKTIQNNIVIKNLKTDFLEIDISSLCLVYGKINNCKIIRNAKESIKNICLINFEDSSSILKLISQIKPLIRKEKIVIEFSRFFEQLYERNFFTSFILDKKTQLKTRYKGNIKNNNGKNELIKIFNSLSFEEKQITLSEILYNLVSKIYKILPKKLMGIIKILKTEKLISIIITEDKITEIVEKILNLIHLKSNFEISSKEEKKKV
jgi:hypothetical protein